ncbi:hypothetical protein OSTOST_20853 [Ostertagia ostertagi]
MKHVICIQDEPSGHLTAGVHSWNEDVVGTPAKAVPKPDIDIASSVLFLPYSRV